MIVAGRLMRSIPAQQQSFLAFDFGEKRTGVASGTRLTGTATPMQTIHTALIDARFLAIEKILAEWQPDALIVGIPTHPDGAAHRHLSDRNACGDGAVWLWFWLHGVRAVHDHDRDRRAPNRALKSAPRENRVSF